MYIECILKLLHYLRGWVWPKQKESGEKNFESTFHQNYFDRFHAPKFLLTFF